MVVERNVHHGSHELQSIFRTVVSGMDIGFYKGMLLLRLSKSLHANTRDVDGFSHDGQDEPSYSFSQSEAVLQQGLAWVGYLVWKGR